ncbi:MAG: hypothetical protein QF828_12890, partial [Pseudomonadales bacterium]|nr:hypothetical protein [Pseudomonadales bacterium]
MVDTGCARMMGGEKAVKDYIAAAIKLGFPEPEIRPSSHIFHVANGESTSSSGTVTLPGKSGDRPTFFEVDVGPWPSVPILLSLTVLRQMGAVLELRRMDDKRGSWICFPEGGPYQDQQLVDLPMGLMAFRSCVSQNPERRAKPRRGRGAYMLTDINDEADDTPDTSMSETACCNWEHLAESHTWTPCGWTTEDEDVSGAESFDADQLDGCFAYATIDPQVYKRIVAGDCTTEEFEKSVILVHCNLGHTRNVEKLMRLFPVAARDRKLFTRILV